MVNDVQIHARMSVSPVQAARSGVRRYGYLLPVGALIVAIYGSTLAALFSDWWRSADYSQGLVIAPFAAIVAWVQRRSVSAISSAADPRGLALAAAGCALHLIGQMAAGVYASELSFV